MAKKKRNENNLTQRQEDVLRFIKKYIANEDLYNELSEKMDNLNHEFSFKPDKTLKGLENFYRCIPTFVPEESKWRKQQ